MLVLGSLVPWLGSRKTGPSSTALRHGSPELGLGSKGPSLGVGDPGMGIGIPNSTLMDLSMCTEDSGLASMDLGAVAGISGVA